MDIITKLGTCKNVREIISTMRNSKSYSDKVVNDCLTPFVDYSIEIDNAKKNGTDFKPGIIEIGLINAFYNGVAAALGKYVEPDELTAEIKGRNLKAKGK